MAPEQQPGGGEHKTFSILSTLDLVEKASATCPGPKSVTVGNAYFVVL
jgi:hypothetical protein